MTYRFANGAALPTPYTQICPSDDGHNRPFVVSLSNHERPLHWLRANGSLAIGQSEINVNQTAKWVSSGAAGDATVRP